MSVFVVPVVALCIPLVVVPLALGLRHARVVRTMEHDERMRALELGIPLPPVAGLNWPGAVLCMAIGAGVPVGAFLLASLAVVAGGVDAQVFGIALLVSFGALWAAKSLADRMIRAAVTPSESRDRPHPLGKVAFDPDTFDVVGRRG